MIQVTYGNGDQILAPAADVYFSISAAGAVSIGSRYFTEDATISLANLTIGGTANSGNSFTANIGTIESIN